MARPWIRMPGWAFANWPVGLMDKASAPGAGDSRFESWAGHYEALPEDRVAWTIAHWFACRCTHPAATPWGKEGTAHPGPRGLNSFCGPCAATTWACDRPALGKAHARAIAAHARFLIDLPPARMCDYWGTTCKGDLDAAGPGNQGGDSAAGSA